MFLKRLEINGFKSFAQKTVFEFSSGIVGIVGPNGSGKSNVIDAIRWLLGEREAKNLRGEKIEDLIFAGTAKKPRMSMAQVSLVFDNTSGQLPVDFKEVVITRKISRNGDSEYYINDAPVRLKDIIDFFSKIKLGTKGLTIIGQGAGDIFVRATPQERMMMVQEILGLREYQIKKSQAARKLKNTMSNLEKVQAMAQEVAPRLRMLKRQTAKWEKRFEVEEQLRDLESDFFAYKIKLLQDRGRQLIEPVGALQERIASLQVQEGQYEKELASLESGSLSSQKLQDIQDRKRALFAKKSDLERKLFRAEAALERVQVVSEKYLIDAPAAQRALTNIKKDLEAMLDVHEMDALKERIHAVLTLVREVLIGHTPKEPVIPKTDEMEKEKAHTQEDIVRADNAIKELEQAERDLSSGVESFNTRFKSVFGQLEQVRMHVQQVRDQQNAIRFETEKNEYKLEELKNYIVSLGGHVEIFFTRAADPTYAVSFTPQELEDRERQILRLRGELSAIGDIDEALLKETTEVEAHYAYLTRESQDLETASKDLARLMTELHEKITGQFQDSFKHVNEEFNTFFRLMFGGGSAKMKIISREKQPAVLEGELEEVVPPVNGGDDAASMQGIDVDISIPQKKITSLEMLSGGEKSLVSIAVLFALIAVSPPPFLVLDEVDSALDEKNSKRFSDLIKNFAHHTQFIVVTHNRVAMEAADVLYGVTMDDGGGSKVLSLKLEAR